MFKKDRNRDEGWEHLPMNNNRKHVFYITNVYAKLLFIENVE